MKIRSIQYLRATAALLVVVAHALLHPLAHAEATYQRLGSFGVLLFFVISGFIMIYTTGTGAFAPGKFLRRRIERIAPLYWLVTFGVSFLAIFAPTLLKNTTFSWDQLIKSLFFIPYARENGEIVPLMKLGWTLNYEMFFYLAFASLAFLSARSRVLLVTLLFVLLVIAGAVVPFESAIPLFLTAPLLLTFCVGMGVGLLYQRQSFLACDARLAPIWLGSAAVFIALALNAPQTAPLSPFTDATFALAAASLVLLGLCSERLLPDWRFGLLLGDASYSLYLVHMYLVAATGLIVGRLVGSDMPALSIASAIGASVIAAIAVHLIVEKPIGRWLRYVDPRARWRKTAASSAI
ncbi:acyltransferase [Novosphingobium sp. RD2P27]|uniref:Acyltransferase n=1 Tax=Novosphingobium kalidii TaxID=3230299 RepID=A0ABV2CZX0_9SPHN